MKYLRWVKENINLVSFVAGVLCLVAGKEDVARVIIAYGDVL